MSTDTLEKNDTKVIHTNDGDHDKFSHYCDKADIEKAILDGIPCTALCGKKWLPNSDPQKYPVCPECNDIMDKAFPQN